MIFTRINVTLKKRQLSMKKYPSFGCLTFNVLDCTTLVSWWNKVRQEVIVSLIKKNYLHQMGSFESLGIKLGFKGV